jgi:heme-degrading monooxygenase HmoA
MARYVLIGTVKIKPGNRPAMEHVADQGKPGLAQLDGFESVTFFLDEQRSLYGAASIWASREAADAADAASTPQFTEAIGDLAEGPIETSIYEVYEPQS